MPVISINTLELLEYQKKSIAKKFTEILARETNVPQDNVYVFFSGFPLNGISAGGILNSDVPRDIMKMFVTKDVEILKQADNIYLIKRFRAIYGQEERARKELMKLLYQMRNAKGCVRADVFQSSVDMISGKLESSFFIVKEIWTDITAQKEFESDPNYQNFLSIKNHLFIEENDTVEGIGSFDQEIDEDYAGKIFVTLRIKANAIFKEKVKKEIFELLSSLKSKTGCLKSNAYKGFEKTNDSNVFILDQIWDDARMFNEAGVIKQVGQLFNKEDSFETLEITVFNRISTPVSHISENAVLGDPELMAGLVKLNPDFGELCINASGVPWGKTHIDQKTKVYIAIAIDVVEQITGKPFENHVHMALKQGITREDLEELLLFLTIYAGFNKAGIFYSELNRIFGPKKQ